MKNPFKKDKDVNPETPEASKKEEVPKEPMVPEKELKEAKAEAEKWKNEYYKAYADLDNLRKNLEKDHSEALRYRSEGFLENLLPALDSFYIALEAAPQGEEAKNYKIGFSYIYNQIQSSLTSEGVSEILPKIGCEFDPKDMHAVDLVETDGPSNKIVKVLMKGYMLHDRLVRPAMVSVSKTKVKKADETKTEPSDAKPLSDKSNEAHKA